MVGFLAALGLTEAVWLAVLSLIRIIASWGSILYIAGYVRDTLTGQNEENIQESRDDNIEAILNRPDLSPETKAKLIEEYLKTSSGNGFKTETLITGAIILVAVMYLMKENRSK